MKRPSKSLRCDLPALAAGLALALAGWATQARGDDWPIARGDASGSGVARSSLPAEPEILWTYQAADGEGFEATAVVAGGIVYVGDTGGVFHALRLSDGQPLWTKPFEGSSFVSAAAVVGERLYVGDLDGVVRCLAIADGAEIWSAEMGAEVYAGPAPHGDAILFTCEGGTMISFEAATGDERWKFTIDAPIRCSPTFAAGRVMLAGCDSKLRFVDAATGREDFVVDIDGPTGATPAVHERRVFFGTEGGSFFAIEAIPEEGEQPSVAWTYRDPRRGQPIRSAAAATTDLVVYGSQGRTVYGIDPASGEPKWTRPLRTRVESSPVIAGDRVVLATTGGIIYLLDVASGEPAWEHEAGGSFTASPVVVDGRLILGNGDGTLYCFGAPPAAPGQPAAAQPPADAAPPPTASPR